ncbi:MAG: FAD-dependent oxidoreductase [Desulfosarcinaceae bacterium]|nr:FAD-dependent oxidoreductase [Desulfosarcinaceae bacterium]
MTHLIIGNGIAGVCAAEAIREMDADTPIVMVSDENLPPYSRPMLSQILEGAQPFEKLPVRSPAFYDQLHITPVLGARVSAVHPTDKRVSFADGRQLPYQRLLIASGADARRLTVPGGDLANIFYLRTAADVRLQLAAIGDARRALVLGGGLVGFKAAYGLMKQGLPVTMLITSAHPLSMQVDPVAGAMIRDTLVTHGLNVEVGISVTAFDGERQVSAAHTDDGRVLPCDLVIVGKGVRPAVTYLPADEIQIDLGVLVDGHLQTSAADVYAAGDVAEARDLVRHVPWVNAIWPEAALQGRIAGQNMAGRPVRYAGSLGRNVMRVFDLDVMALGLANAEGLEGLQVIRSGGAAAGWFRSLVLRDGVLVGATVINRFEQGGLLRALIEQGRPLPVPPESLLSPNFNIARLLWAPERACAAM